jgi:hypothetical protein
VETEAWNLPGEAAVVLAPREGRETDPAAEERG